jgi:hypothetical protein
MRGCVLMIEFNILLPIARVWLHGSSLDHSRTSNRYPRPKYEQATKPFAADSPSQSQIETSRFRPVATRS